MKRLIVLSFFLCVEFVVWGGVPMVLTDQAKGYIKVEECDVNQETCRVELTTATKKCRGIILNDGTNMDNLEAKPDVEITVEAKEEGLYYISFSSSLDEGGKQLMAKASSKYNSMFARLQVNDGRMTKRVVYVPWSTSPLYVSTLGKFWLAVGKNTVRVWLPEHLYLHEASISKYSDVVVEEKVANYVPPVVPPKTHPRLWGREADFNKIRNVLDYAENKNAWENVQKIATKKYEFVFDDDKEVSYDTQLENAVVAKAFYYQMTGDKAVAEEACKLSADYISHVEFGNILDITRELGNALYSVSCVYDWCYDIMTAEQRETILANFKRLRIDMECKWPPFGDSIVNGHGNEAQINRDLIAMSIAIYDEDPEPYKYCSYAILEDLKPLRQWEYQSGRHNQGIGYSSYRFNWEMHGALLFKRMLGYEVFDPNIKNVPLYWIYMRAPNGAMLRDGDGLTSGPYWAALDTMLICYAYSGSELIKNEFYRQGGADYKNYVQFLLLNDVNNYGSETPDALPLTHDFGPILSSMVARTGWTVGELSDDVVAEIKGGGYHFGNHQHADTGSFQIFYHGFLAAKIGQYAFYGTPYDMGFNKRSISKSMLLVRDPDETFVRSNVNDGGSRFLQVFPRTVKQALEDKTFHYGTKESCSFGPSEKRPMFSYYAADLTSAYSEKIKSFKRRFCFLNLGNAEIPAIVIIADDVEASNPAFRKYWQICTLETPEITTDGALLHSANAGKKGDMHLAMLKPSADERVVLVQDGDEVHNVFGTQLTPPHPSGKEAHGTRLLFTPKQSSAHDQFLTVMQITDNGVKPLAYDYSEKENMYILSVGGNIVAMPSGNDMIDDGFELEIPEGKDNMHVLVAGIKAGEWTVSGNDINGYVNVLEGKNTIFFTGKSGKYTISKGRADEKLPLLQGENVEPAMVNQILPGSVLIDGKMVDNSRYLKSQDGRLLVPLEAMLKLAGVDYSESEDGFEVHNEIQDIVLHKNSRACEINGCLYTMGAPLAQQDEKWYVESLFMSIMLQRRMSIDRLLDAVAFAKSEEKIVNPLFVFLDSNTNNNIRQLNEMLRDGTDKKGYWDGLGRNTYIDMVLAKTIKLKGVGIHFMNGAARVASFAIDVTKPDGTTVRVLDGKSSGKSNEMEFFEFDEVDANMIRFYGFGNTLNDWNSIVSFKLLE